ncbi:general secretion pathway protein F [Methylophaga aminisulfidivorans MP]|uniref:General secretion pathway protein F n=2 Tax=Methylophaga TaxID=40222 RepID=F5SUX5_9GAMM|nr:MULTISPECIES: type II secretion system F family protein [Methylophaga]EGL55561.1 general secretion pathway protein F [Methylophaga aminisulfidivorans MP]GLP98839.1 type II secretion system protein GspF [Methylophaga thalassica]
MTKFVYKALSAKGEMITGSKEEVDQTAVVQFLRQSGYVPVSISQQSWLTGSFNLQRKKPQAPLSQTLLLTFFSELATLLDAGLPVDQSLKRMERLTSSTPLKETLSALHQGVAAGDSLAKAMAAQGQRFTDLHINMVLAGETGGHLPQVMNELAYYQETMASLRRQLMSALSYPMILLVMSILSIVMMMTYVIPKFVPLFEGAEQTIPWLTQQVFAVAHFFEQSWWLPLVIFIVMALAVDGIQKHPAGKVWLDGKILKLPIIGSLITVVNIGRFSQSMASMLTHGVGLIEAVNMASGAINNGKIKQALAEVSKQVSHGSSLAKALKSFSCFPSLLTELVEIGEQTGQLEPMFSKVAKAYQLQVEDRTKQLLSLVEPVLIIGLGGIIGVIIISIMLAMLGLNDLVR